jgi:hypothetical protein
MRTRETVLCTLLAWALAAPAATAVARTFHVDGTGTACPGAEFNSIQAAINGSGPGTTIEVCAGTYAEQLAITKRVKLVGVGNPVVRPAPMVANTSSIRTGRPIAAAVEIAAPATMDGFVIDLSQNGLASCGDGDPMLIGVFFRGSSGTLSNSRVLDARHPPAAGVCESGVAVLVQGNGVKRVKATVTGNTVSGYHRAGIVVNEAKVRAAVSNNIVTGAGTSSDQVQNGIQVGFGATGIVTNNVVQGNAGPSGSNCTFDGGNLSLNKGVIKGNTFRGNTAGVIVAGSKNKVSFNMVDGVTGTTAVGLDGISVAGDRNVLASNTIHGVSRVGIRLSGTRNVAKRNTITATHEAALCAATRALPGCTDVLAVCGVGLWIADGTGNVNARNELSDNDTPVRDDGLRTAHTP